MQYLEHPLIKPNTIEARLYQQVIFNTATKSNTLIVLPTGLGKCHAFEDLVLLSDGRVMAIGELVGEAINKSKLLFDGGDGKLSLENALTPRILSLDGQGTVQDAQIEGFYASTVNKTVKIETESGVEVEVTPEHPLLRMEDGKPFWRMAEDFREGDYIGVLRKLNFAGKKQDIDFIASFQNLPKNSAAYVLFDDRTKALLNDLRNDEKARINGILIKGGRSTHTPLKPVWRLTPALARFLGLVISEGRCGRGVMFYNEERTLLNDFRSLSRELFDLKCERIEGGLRLSCTALVYFLRNVFDLRPKGHSREKKIPSLLMKSANDEVSAFIGGLFDGDGSVRKDGVLELMTASEDIANKLPYLLLRLGIKTRVHRKKARATNSPKGEYRTYYRVCIEGLEDIRKFYARIKLKHPEKKERLRRIIATKSANTNVDVFPVGEVIESIRKKLRIRSTRFKDLSEISDITIYEKGKRKKPSRTMLLKILRSFNKRYSRISSINREVACLRDFRDLLYTIKNSLGKADAKSILSAAKVKLRQYREWMEGDRRPRIYDGSPAIRILNAMGRDVDLKRIKRAAEQARKILRISKWELRRNGIYMFYTDTKKLSAHLDHIVRVWNEAMATRDEIRYLSMLVKSDLMWDKVKTIKLVECEKPVFDICVKEYHNFIAGRFGCLPSHNTSLAIMLTASRLMKFPDNKILMMAPTRPLALQHCQTFMRSMTLPQEDFKVLTGQVPPAEREGAWRGAKLIFATPQTVERDIIAGRLALDRFSLIIVDEAHRAVGNYPYGFIAERYMCSAKNPLILGLTASPGAEPSRIDKVKRNLFIEKVEIRSEKDADVRPYVQPIKIEWRRLELPTAFLDVKRLLEGQLKEFLLVLKKHAFLPSIQDVGKRDLLRIQEQIQNAMKEFEPKPPEHLYACLVAQAAAFRLCHAIELLETQGLSSLERYLRRLMKKARMPGCPRAVKLLAEAAKVQQAFHTASRLQGRIDHPKISEALHIVRDQFSSKSNSRVIVFAHYRDSANRLVEEFNRLDGIRATKFIGQADREGEEGLTQREQAQILDKFRNGEVNLLVATAVGEEGLDIPNVDLVLFYEAVPSEIRFIQRRGRTGRTRPGKVVVLLAKGTRDEAFYWSAVRKEERMREALSEYGEVEPVVKEQRVIEEFVPEKIRIIADHREMPSGVVHELVQLGVEVEARQLDVGDFILSDRVGVERKSVGDFLQSIVDKRLLEQGKKLSETFERPVLILEGEGLYSRRAIHPNAIRGALAALAVDFGISVLPTQDEKETAAILAIIARREQTELAREVAIRGEPKGLTLPEQQRFIVEGLPGVSAVLAERLLAHFKTPERVMGASEEELQEVPGIGKVKAKEIRRVLSSLYQP